MLISKSGELSTEPRQLRRQQEVLYLWTSTSLAVRLLSSATCPGSLVLFCTSRNECCYS